MASDLSIYEINGTLNKLGAAIANALNREFITGRAILKRALADCCDKDDTGIYTANRAFIIKTTHDQLNIGVADKLDIHDDVLSHDDSILKQYSVVRVQDICAIMYTYDF